MKLVRNGVFETNSSSAHSLAYGTEYILRGSRWYQPTEDFDHVYWEVTYNGDTNEYYVDKYIKQSNTVILGEDIDETM